MPESRAAVINTSPLIALCAACDDLGVLRAVYDRVVVPLEVAKELARGGQTDFARLAFVADAWLIKIAAPITVSPFLHAALDRGEAAVIQSALDMSIERVIIDDRAGRRTARAYGLQVTGTLGVLLKAKTDGYPLVIRDAIRRMRDRGIWLGDDLVAEIIRRAGE
jgi:predicted nucleic acid-binding protein